MESAEQRIKKHVLVPLGLVLLVVLGISVLCIYLLQHWRLREELEKSRGDVEHLLSAKMEEDVGLLSGMIHFLEESEELQKAWQTRDRRALLNSSAPLLNNRQSRHRVSQVCFIDKERICFLRAHNPSLCGDKINRSTIESAVLHKKSVYGIESGPLGSLTLRVVHPWFIKGELSGYIELGEDIEYLVHQMAETLKVSLVFTVDKTWLDRFAWEKGAQAGQHEASWDLLPSSVLIEHTMKVLPAELIEFIKSSPDRSEGPSGELLANGRKYHVAGVALRDAGNRRIGEILVINDITRSEASARRLSGLLVLLYVVVGGVLFGFIYFLLDRTERRLIKGHNDLASEIEERKEAQRQVMSQLEIINALYAVAQKFTSNLDIQQLAEDITVTCVDAFVADMAWVGRAEPDGQFHHLAHFPEEITLPGPWHYAHWNVEPGGGESPSARALSTGFPVIVSNIESDPLFLPWREPALASGFRSTGAFPLISRRKPFGVLRLYSTKADFFGTERVELLQTYAHQAAAALENARLFEETERRLQHLRALRTIDMAITSSLDLRVTFQILLDQVRTHLNVDAATVLLLNPRTQVLELVVGCGFRSNEIAHAQLRLGEDPAGRAALECRSIHIEDLAEEGGLTARSKLLSSEGFVSCHAVPLVSKGHARGVLEVFKRAPMLIEAEWMEFLEALSDQAAVAIDSVTMFNDLQRSNAELALAYDTTLEGWARALDLRDKETEGHSRRVTELTMSVARVLGLSDEEMVHIRRGALLHDIGKVGIPDKILLKPGPLDDEEWEIMRKHPVYAYELLSPIPFLRPALDIPYCHHEKWDGTGYPRGLRGEQIPLAARIFALIDVWDALRNDRPYRAAWPQEKVLDHVCSLKGTHFDPKVVDAFLTIPDASS